MILDLILWYLYLDYSVIKAKFSLEKNLLKMNLSLNMLFQKCNGLTQQFHEVYNYYKGTLWTSGKVDMRSIFESWFLG